MQASEGFLGHTGGQGWSKIQWLKAKVWRWVNIIKCWNHLPWDTMDSLKLSFWHIYCSSTLYLGFAIGATEGNGIPRNSCLMQEIRLSDYRVPCGLKISECRRQGIILLLHVPPRWRPKGIQQFKTLPVSLLMQTAEDDDNHTWKYQHKTLSHNFIPVFWTLELNRKA